LIGVGLGESATGAATPIGAVEDSV
jgi:hypothetical protein